MGLGLVDLESVVNRQSVDKLLLDGQKQHWPAVAAKREGYQASPGADALGERMGERWSVGSGGELE